MISITDIKCIDEKLGIFWILKKVCRLVSSSRWRDCQDTRGGERTLWTLIFLLLPLTAPHKEKDKKSPAKMGTSIFTKVIFKADSKNCVQGPEYKSSYRCCDRSWKVCEYSIVRVYRLTTFVFYSHFKHFTVYEDVSQAYDYK